jgi:MFS family permease
MASFRRDVQYWKFSCYGFLKSLQFFDPFLILFFREMGISFFQIGILYSIREIITNITEIPTGVIADTFGRRSAMVLAFITYIISFLIFYLLPSFHAYIGGMFFFALGESFRSGTHKAMIMEYLKRNSMGEYKVDYYGHTRSWSKIGSAVSALIAAALVFFSGSYKTVFLWSIVPYFFGALLILSYPRELDFSSDEEEQDPCTADEMPGRIDKMKKTLADFFALFKDPSVRKMLVNSTLFDALFKSVKDYVQPVLRSLAISLPLLASLDRFGENRKVAIVTGITYAILYLLSSQASGRAGSFHERFSSPEKGLNVSYLMGVGSAIVVGIFLAFDLRVAAVTLFIIYYLVENIRRPAALGILSDRIRNSVMATALSGESQVKTVLVAIFAPLFGLGADTIGIGYSMVLLGLLPLLLYPFLRLGAET